MASSTRQRLDELLVDSGLVATRSKAKALIMAGRVEVDGRLVDKAGTRVAQTALVSLKAVPRFVSRGGDKLANALMRLRVDVSGVAALDVGASTGGFTDCLLQEGASRVIALDVGKGQLDYRLRSDERVVVIEGANARYLNPLDLPFRPDFFTMDVSFISVRRVLAAVGDCMGHSFRGLVLVKPQFEARPRLVGKKGIVRDPAVHREVLQEVGTFVCTELGWDLRGVMDSGLPGVGGNREFFFLVSRGGAEGIGLDTLDDIVLKVVTEKETGDGA